MREQSTLQRGFERQRRSIRPLSLTSIDVAVGGRVRTGTVAGRTRPRHNNLKLSEARARFFWSLLGRVFCVLWSLLSQLTCGSNGRSAAGDSQHKMQASTLSNVAFSECLAVFKLAASKDESLLIHCNSFFVADALLGG